MAGDGAIAESTTRCRRIGSKGEGFVGIDRYIPVLEGVLNTPHHKKFFDDAVGAAQADRPDAARCPTATCSPTTRRQRLKIGMQKSGFQRARGHDEAHRGPGGAGDEGRRRLPAGRQGSSEGGPPGIPAASSCSRSAVASTRSWTSSRRKRPIVPSGCKFAMAQLLVTDPRVRQGWFTGPGRAPLRRHPRAPRG